MQKLRNAWSQPKNTHTQYKKYDMAGWSSQNTQNVYKKYVMLGWNLKYAKNV